MMRLIARLMCRYKGHVWRRVRKADTKDWLVPGNAPHMRICDRCLTLRDVKRRKS